MVYQDDALCLILALTGLAAAPADSLRKRIAKQQSEEEARSLRAEFLAYCRRGPKPHLPATLLEELWEQLSKFNRYSFCKSHAVSYALIAWRSAALKAHHPLAFWTAALNNNMSSYARWVYVEAIRAAGLAMLAPCINRSADTFTDEDGKIRTGLGAIAGLPVELRERLLDERDAGGPFRSLVEFRQRIAPGPEALALLIRAGALDVFGMPRPMLFLQAQQKQEERGLELFDPLPSPDWQPTDFDLKRRLRDQWQTLGCVLEVPLTSLLRPKKPPEGKGQPPVIPCTDLPRYRGRVVRIQGLVATGRTAYNANDQPIQFVTLQDAHGLAEVTLFVGQCVQVPYLRLGPYTATGVVEEQYGVFTLTARTFEPCAAESEGAA
jgi:DNA polymerase III alpha subunit